MTKVVERKIDLGFAEKNAEILVTVCGRVRPGECVLVVADDSIKDVGDLIYKYAKNITDDVLLLLMKPTAIHGMEPPDNIAKEMLNADVIFGIGRSSMAHTQARLSATKGGARYLSLAGYSMEQLSRPSLGVDYVYWAGVGGKISAILDVGKKIEVSTEAGTNIVLDITGRRANWCPGFCDAPGTMGSPPDIEVNVSPLETESNGVVVVDGSILCREIGLLKKALRLEVKNGHATHVDTQVAQGMVLDGILNQYDNRARVLAEFGIGLNPKAELCGMMLEDEGALGTIHFGFGSNSTVGGINKINFHLDMVIKNPTVLIDGCTIIRAGVLEDFLLV